MPHERRVLSVSTKCSFVVVVSVLCITFATSSSAYTHHSRKTNAEVNDIYKRSFVAFKCMGTYDVSLLAKLERVCSDCFNLYREPELTMLCSKRCFVNEYFDGCLDALVQEEERKILKKMRMELSSGGEN